MSEVWVWKLPVVGDDRVRWETKQNKEVGEVMVSGGRRFMVIGKNVMGIRGDKSEMAQVRKLGEFKNYFAYGVYEVIEEIPEGEAGEEKSLFVDFEYQVGQEGVDEFYRVERGL